MKTSIQNASGNSYDRVSIGLHWFTAFLVLAIFALALVPGVLKGSIALHNTLGVLLLAIIPARAVWRFTKGRVVHHEKSSRLARLAATCVHGLLYALLLAVPLLGLIYVDAKGIDFSPFGLHVPAIVPWDRDLAQSVYSWKQWTAYSLLGLVFVHAVAAIVYHHLFRRDGTLASMLGTPSHQPAAAVPVMAGSAGLPSLGAAASAPVLDFKPVPILAGSAGSPVMDGSPAVPAVAVSADLPSSAESSAQPAMAGSQQAQPSAPELAYASRSLVQPNP
jgi:cytochrome b561